MSVSGTARAPRPASGRARRCRRRGPAAAVLQQRSAEFLPGGAEGDGVEAGAVGGFQPHAHMRLADFLGIGDAYAPAARSPARDCRHQTVRRARSCATRSAFAAAALTAPSIMRPLARRAHLDIGAERRFEKRPQRPPARPCASVTPAAMAWPPPLSRSPSATARRTARPISTPAMERPEPVPMPPGSSAMAKAGRPNFSFEPRRDECRRRRGASLRRR